MAAETPVTSPKRPLKERAFDEFKRLVVIFLYLWLVFGLLSIHKSLVLSQHNLDVEEHTFAFINAFVFAKVLLVGEHFNLGTRFRNKPLLYPILYKCFVFTVLLMSFHAVRERRHRNVAWTYHRGEYSPYAWVESEGPPDHERLLFCPALAILRIQSDHTGHRPQGDASSASRTPRPRPQADLAATVLDFSECSPP